MTAAAYRAPSAADLAAGRARAPRPEWSANTRQPEPRPFDAQTTAQVSGTPPGQGPPLPGQHATGQDGAIGARLDAWRGAQSGAQHAARCLRPLGWTGRGRLLTMLHSSPSLPLSLCHCHWRCCPSGRQSTYRGAQNPRPATSSGGRPFFDRGCDEGLAQRAPLPFEATTRYHDEYRAHDLRAAAAARTVPPDRHLQQQVSVLPRGARFDANTTSRAQFRPYEIEPPAPAPVPARPLPPPLKFEGQSQTQADYGRKQRDPSQPLGHRHPESAAWVAPHTRFEAHTVNQESVETADEDAGRE